MNLILIRRCQNVNVYCLVAFVVIRLDRILITFVVKVVWKHKLSITRGDFVCIYSMVWGCILESLCAGTLNNCPNTFYKHTQPYPTSPSFENALFLKLVSKQKKN